MAKTQKTDEKDTKAAVPAPNAKPADPAVAPSHPPTIPAGANPPLAARSGVPTLDEVAKMIEKTAPLPTEAEIEALTSSPTIPDEPMLLVPDEDLSDLPEAVQIAIPCFGLKRAHVLGHRLTEDGCVIITRGGRKLHWPGDEEKAAALTEADKDGVPRKDFPPANLLGKRG